jgi:hypothetical protein
MAWSRRGRGMVNEAGDQVSPVLASLDFAGQV